MSVCLIGGCDVAPMTHPGTGSSGVVAGTEAFNFDHRGKTYAIRMDASRGDVTVMGIDPSGPAGAPATLREVAGAVCQAKGLVSDRAAPGKQADDGRVWTFAKACL